MSREHDNELIRRCKQGDQQAMEAIIQNYQKPVFNVAFRMLCNRDDAADVAQTTFLKVFQNLDQFNPAFKLFSWIYRIAINESVSVARRRPSNEEISDLSPSNDPGPADLADVSQVNSQLQQALMTLNEDYRSVIVLKYFTGCSYQQLSAILRIPEKTVKSRLFSARQQMKRSLEQHGIMSS